MSAQRYEYRVVDRLGHPYPSHPTFFEYGPAAKRATKLDQIKKSWGPHCIERRLIVPWQPAPSPPLEEAEA